MKVKLIKGHWYRFVTMGETHIGMYIGRQRGFECCVCGKGGNAYTFNLWYNERGGYETWGYGEEHLPQIVEDLGDCQEIILDDVLEG